MMRMGRILLPVDLAEQAQGTRGAVHVAKALAGLFHSQVTLLHVWSHSMSGADARWQALSELAPEPERADAHASGDAYRSSGA